MTLTQEMKQYANDMVDGTVRVNKYRKKAAERFLRDLENEDYYINEKNVELAIGLMEATFAHTKGSLRGRPFKLEKWQKWITFNLIGFELKNNPGERRFKEAFIYIPRKNGKTFFASALAWALVWIDAKTYANLNIVATKLDRAREAFDNILDNINRIGENKNFKILDNHAEHSIKREFADGGKIEIRALAADTKKADGLNGGLFILDEIHAYKSVQDYEVYAEATKSYTNKLVLGITTAGADQNSFCYERMMACKDILDGKAVDENYFVFICEADNPDDYLDAYQHEIANPNYGVSIRPQDIMRDAQKASFDAQTRTNFLNKSLNIYVDSLEAYFNIDEFQESDECYDWTVDDLAKLPIKWFGGVDLSKMYDLTAACLYGNYKGVDICITHAFFPRTQAMHKAVDDNIPLFGWEDDGFLTMCNSEVVEYYDVVNWFKMMREKGFRVKHVGFDPKFGVEFVPLMKNEKFKMVETPQRALNKNQGARRIERQAKKKKFYYLHSEAYEYCVRNVKGTEIVDGALKYEKIAYNRRIDLFDASVFAAYELEQSLNKSDKFNKFVDSL